MFQNASMIAWRNRERQKVGGQAALRSGSCVCGCDLNFGYQRRNRSSRSSLRTLVLVCSKRWAPRSVHCICCFLTNRLLTTWLIVDSTNAVLIVSPCRRRSPKFGMNSRLLQMYVLKSSRPSTTFFAAFERASIKLNSINKSPSRSRASSVFPCQSRCLRLSKRLDTSALVSGRSSRKNAQRVHADQGVGDARGEGRDRRESGRAFLERIQLPSPARPGDASSIDHRS